MVVAAVGDQAVGSSARPSNGAADGGDAVQERDQLGDVVAVAARDREGERSSGRVDEEVVLGAGTASVDRARTRLGAPFFACTWLESAIARDHSSSPAAHKRASKSACSSAHTPARCHSSRRRSKSLPSRQTEHGSGLGRYRWVVERTVAWLHNFKRLLVRFERRADIQRRVQR